MEHAIVPLRRQLAKLSTVDEVMPDTEPVAFGSCTIPVRGRLLEAWAAGARDPALPLCDWLFTGAPAGIAKDTSS